MAFDLFLESVEIVVRMVVFFQKKEGVPGDTL